LLGAEFTQVYARKYGSRIRPDDDVVPLTPEMRARQGIPRSETVEAINRTIEEQKPLSANNNDQ
jgi:membrane protein